jgi:tetratricopeptide (TPR) repeat protein
MTPRSLILVSLLAAGAFPAAADIAAANAAFRAGQYERALAEAAGLGSADAHALTARTLLTQAICEDGAPLAADLEAARTAAERALAIDATHIEGRLQKAISLSLMTRPMSLSEARESGYGPLARGLAEDVLQDDPENAYALGFLAVWHVEVHRRGGRLGAAIMGANLDDAAALYAEAARLAPEDAGLRWQWARALAAYDAKRYKDEIRSELEAAIAIDPPTELDRVMQVRAAALLELVKSGKVRETERTAQRML